MARCEHITATVDAVDPKSKSGAIIVSMPEMDGGQYPVSIEPVWPAGEWICFPNPGDTVELIVPEGEDIVEHPDDVRYIGKRRDMNSDPVPSEFKTNYPNRRGFKTKAGHMLIVDDKAGTFTIKNGQTGIVIEFDGSGLLHLGVPVGTDFIMKGNTFNTAHATLLTALSTYIGLVGTAFTAMATDAFLISGLQSSTITAMTNAGTTGSGVLITAITTFLNAAATWLSTKVKTG